ncbi:MAG: hypothetical protein QOD72_1996 [Acidimicrobiaceae bacterium]|nr:hypothetical protein [Acidimicrobiaceae bacterium]
MIVPVGDLDRRAVLALRRAAGLPHASVRALHLCSDGDAAHAFAVEWAAAGGCGFTVPLDIIESPPDYWEEQVRAIVQAHSRESPSGVTVVIGRLRLRRRWHRLLHDQSAERIRGALVGIPNVEVEFVDLPV